MKLRHRRLVILVLFIICASLTGSIALALHTTKATHSIQPATHTTTVPKASPAKLAADEAAYKASTERVAQLQHTYDNAKQAEQAALDQYGDGSPEYQAAKDVTDSAYTALGTQLDDQARKSLHMTIDGGTPSN